MRPSPFPTFRAVLRAQRTAGRRMNSSTSSSSSSPTQNPQVQKAMEGASKAYQQSADAVKRVAGPMGARVGSALGGYREPLVYNFQVFTSLCRQVYKAEKLAPPLDLHAWTSAYSTIWARAKSAGYWRDVLRTGAWAGLGIAAIEAYGISCLGEMIGRRNLVGYKLKE